MCDKTCGGGTRTDIRVPKVDVELVKNGGNLYGGKECTGPSTVTESCNVQECPGKFIWNMMNYKKSNSDIILKILIYFCHKKVCKRYSYFI